MLLGGSVCLSEQKNGSKKIVTLWKDAALIDRSFLHILQHTDLMGLRQEVCEFLEWRTSEACLPPQIGSQESISLQQTFECRLCEITRTQFFITQVESSKNPVLHRFNCKKT